MSIWPLIVLYDMVAQNGFSGAPFGPEENVGHTSPVYLQIQHIYILLKRYLHLEMFQEICLHRLQKYTNHMCMYLPSAIYCLKLTKFGTLY